MNLRFAEIRARQAAIPVIFYYQLDRQLGMDPYAKPNERNVGPRRPKIRHVSQSLEPRTRRERQADKEGVAAKRRAIKKAARRHLKERLLRELDDVE